MQSGENSTLFFCPDESPPPCSLTISGTTLKEHGACKQRLMFNNRQPLLTSTMQKLIRQVKHTKSLPYSINCTYKIMFKSFIHFYRGKDLHRSLGMPLLRSEALTSVALGECSFLTFIKRGASLCGISVATSVRMACCTLCGR